MGTASSYYNETSFQRPVSLGTVRNIRAPTPGAPTRSLSLASFSSGFVSETSSISKMPHQPLIHRPSSVIQAFSAEEKEEELKKEEIVVKKNSKLKKVFDGFKACMSTLQDENIKKSFTFDSVLKELKEKVVEVFNKYDTDEVRMVLGNHLARKGFVPLLVKFYEFVFEEFDIEAVTNFFVEEGKGQDDPGYKIILIIREILWNFSDSSFKFGEEIAKTGFFEHLIKDLNFIYEDGLENLMSVNEEIYALKSAVGILHNCARNPDIDRDVFRKCKAASALLPYLQSKVIYVKMITLLALGNILDEAKLSKIVADTDVLNFLLHCIERAMEAKDHMEHGFHVEELVEGLVALSEPHKVKLIIFQKNPLPMIKAILQGEVIAEIQSALSLAYSLAFEESNKRAMLNDKELMTLIKKLKGHANGQIKELASRANFILVDKDDRLNNSTISNVSQRGAAPPIGGTSGPSIDSKSHDKHVMISYCRSDSEYVLKVYKKLLEDKYKVWIDRAQMIIYENVLSGMAEAVENSYVVIVCFSENYKRSKNCRLEAEYAHTRNIELVFCKMQRGYQPDGWLGLLIGAKLYIEFSSHYPFEDKWNELQNRLRGITRTDPPEPDKEKIPTTRAKSIRDWSKEDLDSWMKKHKLEGSKYKKVKDMTGEHLAFMQKLMYKAPVVFYQMAREQLGLVQIEELMRFDDAVTALEY